MSVLDIIASLINHGCFTCDFCDFQEVESLANHFIFVLTTVSLSKYSASDFTVAKAIKLKNRLIDDLDLKGKNSFDYSLVTVQNKLAPLEREKSHKLLSVSSTSTAAEFEERKTLWLETFCTMHELYELAKLVIRKNDDSRFQHHCSQVACGQTPDSTCPWLYVTCTNPDCGKLVSRCRLEMHDNECPHKVVPCSNGCGFGVQRCLLPQHLSDQCGERIVACPYKTSLECEFGKNRHYMALFLCSTYVTLERLNAYIFFKCFIFWVIRIYNILYFVWIVMKAKDVDSHVNENISHHFNLSMTKLGVMDATITQLNHEKMMMSAELNNLQNQLMAARRYSSNHHHGPP